MTTKRDPITGDVQPLFGLPVQVAKATQDADVTFDIAAPSGAPRKQVYVDTATGEQIADDQCPRGVRLGDQFRPIDPDTIRQITEATKLNTMVVSGALPLSDVPWDRSTGTYYLQSPAKGGSPTAYRLLYEALLAEKRALVTKRTARSKQKNAVIYADPQRECLVLQELRFARQLREPDEQVLAPQQAVVAAKQVTMARKVIRKLPDGLEALNTAEDEAVALKQKLIEEALAGEPVLSIPTATIPGKTDDLTALLEQSLAV